MRSASIGGREVALGGGPLTVLTWYNAFGEDTLYDALVRVSTRVGADGSPKLPMMDILRCAWAMAQTAAEADGGKREGFESWAAGLGEVDFVALRAEVEAEALASFFPSLARQAEGKKAARRGRAPRDAGGGADEREAHGAEL